MANDLKALIVKMIEDENFQQEVIKNPENFKSEYSLSDQQVENLKNLNPQEFREIAGTIESPESFVSGVLSGIKAVNKSLQEGGQIGEAGCTYGG
jgi:hypothetical protein